MTDPQDYSDSVSSDSSAFHFDASPDNATLTPESSPQTPSFVHILQTLQGNASLFASHQYYTRENDSATPPSLVELIAHLKLLRSFSLMKSAACKSARSKYEQDYLWKAFISNATRRFVVFVSALKAATSSGEGKGPGQNEDPKYFAKTPKNPVFVSTVQNLLPPLDVLLVWYCLLVHSKTAYDVFARNNFLEFVFHPFPLQQVNSAISNESFDYNPSNVYKENFLSLVSKFNCKMTFRSEEAFDPSTILVPIKCTSCHKILKRSIPLSKLDKTGFINKNFRVELSPSENCNCGFSPLLTHETLRLRQLQADIAKLSDQPMPNIYKMRSRFFMKHSFFKSSSNLKTDDYDFKLITFDIGQTNLDNIVRKFNGILEPPHVDPSLVLDEYLQFELMHFTVPKKEIIEISRNVLHLVYEQERFFNRVDTMNVLQSADVLTALDNAVIRYENYWTLLKKFNKPLIPTLDIDLVWLTHQLSFHNYYNWSVSKRKSFHDHPQNLVRSTVNKFFQETAVYYYQYFQQSYSNCKCSSCLQAKPVVKDNDFIINKGYGFTHVSRYNTVDFHQPTTKHHVEISSSDSSEKSRRHASWYLPTHNVSAVGGGFF